jgi:hypothetical protein
MVMLAMCSDLVWSQGSEVQGAPKKTKGKARQANLKNLVALAMLDLPPPSLQPAPGYGEHHFGGDAIFSAAMDTTSMRHDALRFVGSLRRTGYMGDIVLAVLSGSRQDFMDALKEKGCIVYIVDPICGGESHEKKCRFEGQSRKEAFSINMVRFFLYKWWAQKYSSDSRIILSDFRDVFFQQDPFKWPKLNRNADMQVFLENHPTKVINRCPFNNGWIENCYGSKAIEIVGSHTVSCSGVSLGKRDAVVAYTHLMLAQLSPSVRMEYKEDTPNNVMEAVNSRQCISLGMDQGFHNWLLYSGQLSRYMDVMIFPNGDGLVNTLGSLKGERAPLKWTLEEWGIIKTGKNGLTSVHNWDGEMSPIVHQADRWMDSGLYDTLSAFYKLI